MKAIDLLLFLEKLRNSELQKEIILEVALGDRRPLLDIDDADPHNVYLMSFVHPHSEN